MVHTGARVGINNSDAFLARAVLEESFLGAIIAGTSQPGEIEENRHFV